MRFGAIPSVTRPAVVTLVVFSSLALLTLHVSAGDSPPSRTWTDAASGRTIEAEFLGLSDGKIRLRTPDGRAWELSLTRLIQADRDFVEQTVKFQQGRTGSAAHSAPKPKESARLRVFTDKRTGQSITGYVVRRDESSGHPRLMVRTETGEEIWFFSAQCDIVDAAQPSQDGNSGESFGGSSGRSEVQINLPEGLESMASGLAQAREVVTTGVGLDPDRALQDALSRAIEQAVGVLVDAETVLKNDQLIRDEVLTYSRGFVEKYEIVKRREADGLHHATIRAIVSQDKLVQRLREMKIAVQNVQGDIAARQFEFDAKNEEQAAEMLKKALAGFDMTKLTKVEIVGQPEIDRDGDKANVKVTVRLTPDLNRWREFSRDLRLVLSKAASKRGAVAWSGQEFRATQELANQLEGRGVLIALLVNANMSGDQMSWDLFRVPEPLEGAVKVTAPDQNYRVVCVLLGDENREIARMNVLESGHSYDGLGRVLGQCYDYYLRPNPWCIGPIWLGGDGGSGPIRQKTVTMSVSQGDLKDVRKAAAFLTKVAGN